jgi:SAM-dependent methyltransferase
MDQEVQQQLALQVTLSFQRHHDFMIEHGLARCRDVVDIGTGSGRFLVGVASRHPTIKFHGVDDQSHMVRAAADFDLPNIDWSHADAFDSEAATLLSAADGVLMRNVILHLPNTASSLQEILQATRPGTRVWIFEVDLDHCSCVPDSAAFRHFLAMVQEFCGRSGVEIRTGALLPDMLAANRYEVAGMAVEPFNNREIPGPRFAEYLLREASLYHYALYGTPGTTELLPLRELLFGKARDGSQFVQYGMVMVAAEKQSW